LKETGGRDISSEEHIENATQLTRKSITSMQSALSRSLAVPDAMKVGVTATLQGLETMARANVGGKSSIISPSTLELIFKADGSEDPFRRFGGTNGLITSVHGT